jgi:hypothetical protein
MGIATYRVKATTMPAFTQWSLYDVNFTEAAAQQFCEHYYGHVGLSVASTEGIGYSATAPAGAYKSTVNDYTPTQLDEMDASAAVDNEYGAVTAPTYVPPLTPLPGTPAPDTGPITDPDGTNDTTVPPVPGYYGDPEAPDSGTGLLSLMSTVFGNWWADATSWVASLFSPSVNALQTGVLTPLATLKATAAYRWPFAAGTLAGALFDFDCSGSTGSWQLDLNGVGMFAQSGRYATVDVDDWLPSLQPYRPFAVGVIWILFGICLFQLLKPKVGV